MPPPVTRHCSCCVYSAAHRVTRSHLVPATAGQPVFDSVSDLVKTITRASPGARAKCVTFVTGPTADASALAATFAAGADDFIALPCAPDTLQSRIAKHMRAFEAPAKRAGAASVSIREIGPIYNTGPTLEPISRPSDMANTSSESNSLEGAARRGGERDAAPMRQQLHGDWAAHMQARPLPVASRTSRLICAARS